MNKFPVATAGAIMFGVAMATVTPVQAATFQEVNQGNLEFFDSSGNTVGSGSFSYESVPFEGTVFGTPPSSVTINANQNLRPLTSLMVQMNLNFDLSGQTYSYSPDFSLSELSNSTSPFWQPTAENVFPPGSGGPFSVAFDLNGNTNLVNAWLLGNDFSRGQIPREMLSINSSGEWTLDGQFPANLGFRGTWQATAVPEPSTIAGTFLSVIALIASKRKRKVPL